MFAATVPLHPARVHLLFGYFGPLEKISTSTVNRTILKVKIFPHPRPAIARSLRFRDSTCCPARRAVSRLGRRLQHSCVRLLFVYFGTFDKKNPTHHLESHDSESQGFPEPQSPDRPSRYRSDFRIRPAAPRDVQSPGLGRVLSPATTARRPSCVPPVSVTPRAAAGGIFF